MRKQLLSGVALLTLTMAAATAYADQDSSAQNVQINSVAVDAARTKLKNVQIGGSLLDVSTQAVGNTLSVDNSALSADQHVQNYQVNSVTTQTAVTVLKGVALADGDLKVNTAAVGNNASVTVENAGDIKLRSAQSNTTSVQSAKTIVVGSALGGAVDVSTVAVGNNLNADAQQGGVSPHGGAIIQTNGLAIQDAKTVLAPSSAIGQNGAVTVSTEAVGNNASVNGAAGKVKLYVAGQGNDTAIQNATTKIVGVSSTPSGAGNAVSTVAVGDNLNVTAGGAITIAGGFPNGQLNVNSLQTARTDIGSSGFAGKLDVQTAALGNSANFTANGGAAKIGGFGLSGDDYAQANTHTIQAAFTSLKSVGVGGDVGVTTAAIGNALSVVGQGTASLDAIQLNTNSAQYAGAFVGPNVGIGGSLKVSTQAIGNAASVTVK